MKRTTSLFLVALLALGALRANAQQNQTAQDPAAPIGEEEPLEPDYAEVAADARKIADEIEERLIETHMNDARAHLRAADGPKGHPKAFEAYTDMEEMIAFCESTAEGAGAACRFKLKLQMSLNPGNTIGQLSKSMSMGQGFMGSMGQGAQGQAGSRSRFNLYGPRPAGQPSRFSSRLSDQDVDADSRGAGDGDPLSGRVEELANSKRSEWEFTAESDGRIMEEYRTLIEAYFKTVAEESP